MYLAPFAFRGDIFNSIEHVHHATKFLHEGDFYRKFTRKGIYGSSPHTAKLADGRNGCNTQALSEALRRPARVTMDPKRGEKRHAYLLEAQLAKYRSHPHLM